MTVKLNDRAFEHAKELITDGHFVFDERDAWSEHQPSAQEENEFIREHLLASRPQRVRLKRQPLMLSFGIHGAPDAVRLVAEVKSQ